jgi:hypothetical protein
MGNKKQTLESLLTALSEKGLRYDLTIGHPVKVAEEFSEEEDATVPIYTVVVKLEIMTLDKEGKLQTFRKIAASGVDKSPMKAAELALEQVSALMPNVGFDKL